MRLLFGGSFRAGYLLVGCFQHEYVAVLGPGSRDQNGVGKYLPPQCGLATHVIRNRIGNSILVGGLATGKLSDMEVGTIEQISTGISRGLNVRIFAGCIVNIFLSQFHFPPRSYMSSATQLYMA